MLGCGGGVVGGGVTGGGVVGGGVGGGVGALTVILLLWLVLPPVPLQVKVKVVVALRLVKVWLPDVALLPFQEELVGVALLEALQEVALVVLQVRVLDPGDVTVAGLTLKLRVGGLALVVTLTVELCGDSLPALS